MFHSVTQLVEMPLYIFYSSPVSALLEVLCQLDLVDDDVVLGGVVPVRHPVVAQHHHVHVSTHAEAE